MRIALHQGPARADGPEAGLQAVRTAARRAAAAGARLLVTPEMSLTGYTIYAQRVADLAEPVPGPLTDRVQVLDQDGTLLAGYRKAHLYGDVDRTAFVPAQEGVVQFELDGPVVGLLNCYDVEFPEAVRAHALAGTELLVVPTGLMDPYDHVSTVLVPARADESQLFLAHADRTGTEAEATYCGGSCVLSPEGTTPARAGRGGELLVADVDPTVPAASRAVDTHLTDRRPELYRTPEPTA